MSSFPFPLNLVPSHLDGRGAAGRDWLDRLPGLIEECVRHWSLRPAPPFAVLSYSYVTPVFCADGAPAVLKICFPDPELSTEAEALRIYDGQGAVRLLQRDLDHGALLLERLEPGTPLSVLAQSDDSKATSIAAGVMRQLWRSVPPGHPFPSVADWAAGLRGLRGKFEGTTGPLPARLIDEAQALFAELLASMTDFVLLHGDLHHDNILTAQRQPWLAIDPKGVIGEPAYEAGALLRNPISQLAAAPDPARLLGRRIDQLAEELGIDRERLRGWGLAQAVLASWWALADTGRGWERYIACAEVLAALKTEIRPPPSPTASGCS